MEADPSSPAPIESAIVELPDCYSIETVVDRNKLRQLLIPADNATVEVNESGGWEDDRISLRFQTGARFRAVRSSDVLRPGEQAVRPRLISVLRGSPGREDFSGAKWVGDLAASTPEEARTSWEGTFSFVEDNPEAGRPGLRIPQLGAIHAVVGHWTTASTDPATVVMPTGTGKTEAMLGLLIFTRPTHLLVLVPSDALRDQIALKFETLGVLRNVGVVKGAVLRPVVGRIHHGFTSASSAVEFASACNVVVATPNALNGSSPDARKALFATCTHLFIDEAHHVEASTWRQIRDEFVGRPVVQFTATPFREDGRHLGGRMIYVFPLREAQKRGYFSAINYISILDFDNPDRAIAEEAIKRLRADLAAGRDHLIMARVNHIGRAEVVLDLYRDLAPDLSPVFLHSKRTIRDQRVALAAVRDRTSRIVVCVDMLGEGFDLPSLKVAAIHDTHKSLGVTLQFVGRFARATTSSIGEATVVVGRPDRDYDEHLRYLYAEDADWNLIIRDLSETAVGQEEQVSEFETAFGTLPEEVSLRNIAPKMSTVVYRGATSWDPDGVLTVFPEEQLYTFPIALNSRDHVAWFVTEANAPVRWGSIKTITQVTYELYVMYWSESAKLLYINSSNNASLHEELAKAVGGPGVERISGVNVYRTMAGTTRLVPTNVGLLDVVNRSRRFSMHVGADVTEGFPKVEAATKTKTNIFAFGYENEARVSIGASVKGRIWSYRVAESLKQWMDWCNHIGQKLTDDTLNIDAIMLNFIRPEVVEVRPALIPLSLEWPWEVLASTSDEVLVEYAGQSWPLIDTDLRVTSFSDDGPIPFAIESPYWSVDYQLTLGAGAMGYKPTTSEADVVTRHARIALSEFLKRQGLTVHFEKDAVVVPPGLLLKPERDLPVFDRERIEALDWTGIDIRKESQGAGRESDSVQARVIRYVLEAEDWDLVIDDDGKGETADVVALKAADDRLIVRLYHCKYSGAATPGARLGDLYEVCGQALKSVQWRRKPERLFDQLIRREKRRRQRDERTGFEKGDGRRLYKLDDMSRRLRPDFGIVIAQPGLSKGAATTQQLELLAATEVYLRETFNVSLDVLASS